jgi:pimeloyl-ACP methyl ester carboxylesterase
MDKLHVDVFGAGDSAIFVHGSFGWGLDTFPEQRALSDEYRIILVDRRGFAGSSSLEAMGWPADMHDVAALLERSGQPTSSASRTEPWSPCSRRAFDPDL